MKAINLRTEYLVNPVGIEFQHPRLMWVCKEGLKQTAYQIVTGKMGQRKSEQFLHSCGISGDAF